MSCPPVMLLSPEMDEGPGSDVARCRAAFARVGTAGWSIPSRYADRFPAAGTQLARYAARLGAAEINSSFYRPHRRATYQRWADAVPESFRFAVKLPRTITHEHRLARCGDLLTRFLDEAAGLGTRLGALLVQLPPGFAYDELRVTAFFRDLAGRVEADLACEPRHPSWFTPEADAVLAGLRVARVAADPPRTPGALEPGGWSGCLYYRLHGHPRIYFSAYDPPFLADIGSRLQRAHAAGVVAWCIFDNTASGAALGNALELAGAAG